MISIKDEEKLRKTLGMFILFFMPVFTNVVKDDALKLMVIIPLVIILGVLSTRKFISDRKEGKLLTRYYIGFGFLLLSLATFIFMMFYI